MPSFADSIFLFVLALLLFGPKKLPVLARELGKWMGEFRRASNEFKMQMEDELRASEREERQQKVAAMEAAAPIPPPLGEPAEPEHPHLRYAAVEPAPEPTMLPPGTSEAQESEAVTPAALPLEMPPESGEHTSVEVTGETRPVPIATSGSLRMMPPATGLPVPRSARVAVADGAEPQSLLPEQVAAMHESEGAAHGE